MNEQNKTVVLTPEMVGLFLLMLESLLKLAPIIAEGISNMTAPEQTKEEYLARIKAAQDSVTPWV